MKLKILILLVIVVFVCFTGFEAYSQCPMCRIAAESNLQHGGTAGRGLNLGILYMLAMPYLFVTVLGFIWWKNRHTDEQEPLT